MKSVAMKRAKDSLAEVLDDAQDEDVVITRHGQPAVLVIGVEGLDAEQIALGRDEGLWRMIERRRRGKRKVPHAQVRRLAGL